MFDSRASADRREPGGVLQGHRGLGCGVRSRLSPGLRLAHPELVDLHAMLSSFPASERICVVQLNALALISSS